MMFDSALSNIQRLVAYNTSTGCSNLDLLDYVIEQLKPLGFRFRFTYSNDGSKANLLASIGPEEQSGILLSGHTDVVPAKREDWSSDPFRTVIRDDRLYGRGTCDMKGFLGLCLGMAPEFAATGMPVHLAFSYDEEIGCVGAPRLVDDLKTLPAQPRLCIVGEPTLMQTIVGHKSKTNILCRIVGRECHSSSHHLGVNAIEIAAEIIQFLHKKQDDTRNSDAQDMGYDPPYTTLHTGWIRGGKAVNIVPQDCSFEFEIRALSEFDDRFLQQEISDFAAGLMQKMQQVAPESGIAFEVLSQTPALTGLENSEAATLAHHCSGNHTNQKVCFGTEAGLFCRAGIPTVVCGPGDIAQAHRADEFISLDQLRRGHEFLMRLNQWLYDQGRTST